MFIGPACPPARVCAECHEVGQWRHLGTNPFGAVWRRDPCSCEQARLAAVEGQVQEQKAIGRKMAQALNQRQAIERSGLPQVLRDRFSFEEYDATRSGPQSKALAHTRGWAETYRPGARGWALTGTSKGVGKTHLLIATCSRVLCRGYSVHFATLADLLSRIRADIPTGVETTVALARSVDVLALDDMGVERIAEGEKGDWTREVLFRIIDHRALYGKTVLFTSNQTPTQMAARIGGEHGERIVSRLAELCQWRTLDGPDGRTMGARQWR